MFLFVLFFFIYCSVEGRKPSPCLESAFRNKLRLSRRQETSSLPQEHSSWYSRLDLEPPECLFLYSIPFLYFSFGSPIPLPHLPFWSMGVWWGMQRLRTLVAPSGRSVYSLVYCAVHGTTMNESNHFSMSSYERNCWSARACAINRNN